jgi:hypothetical protein
VKRNTNGAEGVAFLLNLDSGEAEPMSEITLAAAGLKERQDLQRWITDRPELIGPALLITTEVDQRELREQKVADRLDALFLDASVAPLATS